MDIIKGIGIYIQYTDIQIKFDKNTHIFSVHASGYIDSIPLVYIHLYIRTLYRQGTSESIAFFRELRSLRKNNSLVSIGRNGYHPHYLFVLARRISLHLRYPFVTCPDYTRQFQLAIVYSFQFLSVFHRFAFQTER